jgi:hypothetical protein
MNTLKYALVSVLWPAMVVSAQSAAVKVYSEPDAAEVYGALFATRSKKPILFLSTTVKPHICSVSEKEAEQIKDPAFREAMSAFRDVNEQVWDLSRVLEGRKTTGEGELDETFKPGVVEGWKQFRQRYAHSLGYFALSAIGFNNAHTAAVVYSEGRCGGLCGAGGFKYLRRTPDGWKRVNTGFPQCDWIS